MTAAAARSAISLPGPFGRQAGRCVMVGGMVFTSGIPGINAETGQLDTAIEGQIDTAFRNLGSVLRKAGVGGEGVGLVNVAIAEGREPDGIEEAFSRLFPDAAHAPMRKINSYPLPPDQGIQVQAVGATHGPQQFIEVPGFAGIGPRGARLGNTVFSGVIDGRDPATGRCSADRKAEMRQAFANMAALVEAAGGTTRNLIHVLIFIRGRQDQPDMLDAWLEAFPEDGNRPARKAIFDPSVAQKGKSIHLLCVATLGDDERINLEVPGISKRHPNPMGCKIGNLVFSSGIGGDDPDGMATGQDPSMRAALALRNMQVLLEQAGGGLDDIGMVSVTVNGYADEAEILSQWDKFFPDPDDAPARQVMAFGGRGSYPVQLHVIAALAGH